MSRALTKGGHEQLCPAKSFCLSCREELRRPRRPYSKAGILMTRRQLTPQQLQELRELAVPRAKSSLAAPSGTTAPDSTSISTPWSRSLRPPPPGSTRAPCKPSWSNKPTPWARTSAAPAAGARVPSGASNARSRCRTAPCSRANRWATIPTAAGTFSPQRPLLRLDGHGYSPGVLRKIVTAGARLHSFADAAFALGLGGLSISARHVQQLTQEVGTALARAGDEQ